MELKFRHPFTLLVAGPTNSGKTELVKRIVKYVNQLIQPVPTEIIWSYSEFQDSYFELQVLPNVQFCEGIPDLEHFKKTKHVPRLLILDDLMHMSDCANLTQLFTKGSHHNNISVINIVQNIFYNGLRTSRVNSQYLILLKNPSDNLQVSTLARQLFPKNPKHLLEAYADATSTPHSYLLLDLHQHTLDNLRLRTNIFPGDITTVYTQK